jgi:hypothetical protein
MAFEQMMAFDTDAPELVRGFELGRLWEQLQAEPEHDVEQLVHISNAEMVMRLAETFGREVASREQDETWMTVRFRAAVRNGAFRR